MGAKTRLVPLLCCGALSMGAGCAGAPERGTQVVAEPEQELASGPELALATAPAPSQHARLEAIFWACDYVATTQGMDATPVRECAAATRELRQVKFAGSFHAMLAWWRENKSAEHSRLRRSRNEQPL